MSERKVVGIHGGRSVAAQYAKPLPAAIIKVRDLFKEKLQNGIRRLFDNADDALFELADRASSNADQALYFDAMRELRLQKRHIANHCIKEVIIAFNEASSNDKGANESNDLLEWNLLENDELEVKVAVEAMVSRVTNESGQFLKDLNTRCETLLPTESFLLPTSPKILCDAFTFACSDLDFGIRAKLIVLKLFEKYVLSEYPKLYEEANNLLIKEDILPNLNAHRRETTASKSRIAPSQSKIPVLDGSQFVESECGSQFDELVSLLHGAQPANAAPASTAASNVVYINQTSLLDVLTQEQHINTQVNSNRTGGAIINFEQLIASKLLKSDNSRLNQVDTDVINLVSMLFEFILEDRQLQAEMKALIARLQIPILKVAILDRSFFDRGGHPARRLLNELASAAIGWTPQNGKRDVLREKLENVVERIQNEFTNNVSLFSDLLNEFLVFIERERKRGKLVEQRTKDSENGRALTIQANQLVKESIETVFADIRKRGREIPQDVEQVTHKYWGRLMSLRFLKYGEDSQQFQSSLRFLNDLSTSVCPQLLIFDARGQLVALIPKVVQEFKEGLAEIAVEISEVEAACRVLESAHIDALNALQTQEEIEKQRIDDEAVADLLKETLDIEEDFNNFVSKQQAEAQNEIKELEGAKNKEVPATQPENTPTGDKTSISKIEKASSRSFDQDSVDTKVDEVSPSFIKQVERLSVGTWFEIEKDKVVERCKLAAVIKSVDKYIFVNRSGVKVDEYSKNELAVLLSRGCVQVLNDGLLFDRALESVIGSLRKTN